MTTSIIGVGNLGGTVARHLVAGGERPERLDVVRARRKHRGDHGAGRLAFRQRPDHLTVLEADRVRRIDDDLVLEQAGKRRDVLPRLREPRREHDGVRIGDGVLDGGSARVRPELLRQRPCVRFVEGGQDDGLSARHEVPGDRASEVADTDD